MRTRDVGVGVGASLLMACASGSDRDARYPRGVHPASYEPRPEGCPVTVFEQAPTMRTENIGAVSATCTLDTSDADCLRELTDQACKLGADVLWGVGAVRATGSKKRLSGRAAHTR